MVRMASPTETAGRISHPGVPSFSWTVRPSLIPLRWVVTVGRASDDPEDYTPKTVLYRFRLNDEHKADDVGSALAHFCVERMKAIAKGMPSPDGLGGLDDPRRQAQPSKHGGPPRPPRPYGHQPRG